jgi:hypothetical protein
MALYLLRPSEMATAWLFCGRPRSGKSYHAVQIIDKWIRSGGHVLTNIELNLGKKYLGRRCGTVKTLPTVLEVIEGIQNFRPAVDGHILLVLDEVASCFDSRNFKNFPPDLRAFLAQHAKMRISIITIVHRHDLVDTSFRKLAGYAVEHVAMSRSSGFFGMLCGIIMPGLMYRHTEGLDSKGDPDGEPYEKKFYFGKKRVYDLYDTFQIAEGSFAGSVGLKQGVVVQPGVKRKLILVGIIFCIFRFTGFNRPPQAAIAAQQKPYVTVHGQVVMCDLKTGLCDLQSSAGEYYKMKPLISWGDPADYIGRFVAVDIPSTATVLRNLEIKEKLLNEPTEKK